MNSPEALAAGQAAADRFKTQMAEERARFADLLRDPWDTFGMDRSPNIRASLCPICSAWVWSVDKHRNWHLRNLQ